MASFTQRKVAEYLIIFLEVSRGQGLLDEKSLAGLLKDLGYAVEPKTSISAARELIASHDFTCNGVLTFEDFLLAMEEINFQVEELRAYLRKTLEYFCARKLQQNAPTQFGLDDLPLFLGRLTKVESDSVMRDFEQDVINLFKPKKNKGGKNRNIDDDDSTQDERNSSMKSGSTFSSTGKSSFKMKGSDRLVSCPEGTLVDIIVNRIYPKPQEPVLYECIQGHLSQQIHIHSLSVRSLGLSKKTKLLKGTMQYMIIDPIFVVSGDEESVCSKPIRDYNWREETTEQLMLELKLPSLKSADVARWIDETDITISVYDYNDTGISPWTEWIGTARRRLSWFLARARDATPIACSVPLDCITPKPKYRDSPSVEFTITIPLPLVQLWHTFRERNGVHPQGFVIADTIRKTLPGCLIHKASVVRHRQCKVRDLVGSDTIVNQINGDSSGDESDSSMKARVAASYSKEKFDIYAHWKKRRLNFRSRFPRRRLKCLAKDESGNFHALPCFVEPTKGFDFTTLEECAESIAALDTGTIAHVDSFHSPYQYDIVASMSLVFSSGKASGLEAAIALCSTMLGIGTSAFVCICDSEEPWVITITSATSQRRNVVNDNDNGDNDDDDDVDNDGDEGSALTDDDGTEDRVVVPAEVLGQVEKKSRRVRMGVYSRKKEAARARLDRKKCSLRFWEPSTGYCFSETDPQAPRYVDCVFNDQNLWFNVQKSNRVLRCTWSTIQGPNKDVSHWEPFFPSALKKVAYLQNAYSTPDFSAYPSLVSRHGLLESKILLSDLVDAISLYRHHKLFLPDTRFDKNISRVLQSELARLRKEFERLGKFDFEEFKQTWDVPPDHSETPEAIVKALPPASFWNGTIYSFSTINVQEIMLRLEEIGILNNTIPNVRYTVATAITPRPWGLSETWVYIGTLLDIGDTLTLNQ